MHLLDGLQNKNEDNLERLKTQVTKQIDEQNKAKYSHPYTTFNPHPFPIPFVRCHQKY